MKESEFRFLGYRVSKVNIDLKDEYKPNEELENSISIENRFTPEDNRFVEVVFNLYITSPKNTFDLSLQIKGGFLGNEKMSDELFETLYKQNAPAILYPFARAIVTSYTSQMNIPPIILPTLNFSIEK
jgi:preprotein translocase subunit SecB